jgi:hypothetical protein
MTHRLPLSVWAVWLDDDHIHTQADGKLAIFESRGKAESFVISQSFADAGRMDTRPMRLKTRPVKTA